MSFSKKDANQLIKQGFNYSAIQHGAKGSIGTSAVPMVAGAIPVACGVSIKALAANSDKVYVGVAGVTSSTGYPLAAGEEVFIAIDDISKVYVVGGSSGQEVRYIGS